MKSFPIRGLLLFTALAIPMAISGAQFPAPPRVGYYVADEEKEISESWESYISDLCREVELVTGIRMTAATVSSIEGEDIDSYARDLLAEWRDEEEKLLVLVAAMDEHKITTAVSENLDDVFTASDLSRIKRKFIIPNFKQRRYGRGVYWGLRKYAEEIEDAYDVSIESLDDYASSYEDRDVWEDEWEDGWDEGEDACAWACCLLGWHLWWWELWADDDHHRHCW